MSEELEALKRQAAKTTTQWGEDAQYKHVFEHVVGLWRGRIGEERYLHLKGPRDKYGGKTSRFLLDNIPESEIEDMITEVKLYI